MTWDEAISEHGDVWSRIVSSKKLNPTLLPGWLDVIVRARGHADDIQVLALSEARELKAVVPYFTAPSRKLGVSIDVVELLTNVVSYHADLITLIDREQVWRYFCEKLDSWHVIRAANFVAEGAGADGLHDFVAQADFTYQQLPVDESPYLSITSDWDTFIASKKKKFRYKLRQRQTSLRENRKLSLSTIKTSISDASLLRDIIHIEERSWKAKYGLDIGSRVFERSYYSALLPYLDDLGALHLDLLYYEEEPIAYSLCANWNGWFGQLKTSFDVDYSELSPGAVVIDSSIRAAFRAGAREFDFLGDMDRHKLSWTRDVRRHIDFFLYSTSLKSRALHSARSLKRRWRRTQRIAAVKTTQDG